MNTTTQTTVVPTESTEGGRLVRANLQGVIVHITCPDWCVIDHAAQPVMFIQDVNHVSAHTEDGVLPLAAHLFSYPYSGDGLGVQVAVDLDGDSSELNADEARQAAAELRTLAAQLEALAALADGTV